MSAFAGLRFILWLLPLLTALFLFTSVLAAGAYLSTRDKVALGQSITAFLVGALLIIMAGYLSPRSFISDAWFLPAAAIDLSLLAAVKMANLSFFVAHHNGTLDWLRKIMYWQFLAPRKSAQDGKHER